MINKRVRIIDCKMNGNDEGILEEHSLCLMSSRMEASQLLEIGQFGMKPCRNSMV
jgi:hypothetical protein